MKGERRLYTIEELHEAIQAAETLNLDYKIIRSKDKRRSFFIVEKEISCWRFIIQAEAMSALFLESFGQPGTEAGGE